MITTRLYHPMHTASGPGALEVDFQLAQGEFLAVSGPSGGGKTTLLRILAGLLHPQHGQIRFGNTCWLDTSTNCCLRPQARQVGIVFQDYALFPNMTVQQNLSYGLQKGQPKAILEELIDIVALEELLDRYPHQLSGGQQQRVALARALVRKPALLLLDEPLSALDSDLRIRLQDYILQMHHHYGLTTILVSHDYAEITKMANQMIRLEAGRISYAGPPEHHAGTPRIALTFLQAALRDGQHVAYFRHQNQIIALPISAERSGTWIPGHQVWIHLEDTPTFTPLP